MENTSGEKLEFKSEKMLDLIKQKSMESPQVTTDVLSCNLHLLEVLLTKTGSGTYETESVSSSSLNLNDESLQLYDAMETLKSSLLKERKEHEKTQSKLKESIDKVDKFKRKQSVVNSEKNNLLSNLASSMGHNAELNIRSKHLEEKLETTQNDIKSMKIDNRKALYDINFREEKLKQTSAANHHLKKDVELMKDQFINEKIQKAQLIRTISQLKQSSQENEKKHIQLIKSYEEDIDILAKDLKGTNDQLSTEKKKAEEMHVLYKKEKEKLIVQISKLKSDLLSRKKQNEIKMEKMKESITQSERTENGIHMQRFVDENQLLRERLLLSESEVKLLQRSSNISYAELAMRRLEARNEANSSETVIISQKARIKELESLLNHSQTQQKQTMSMLEAAQSNIERMMEERDSFALDLLREETIVKPPQTNPQLNGPASPRRKKTVRESSVPNDEENYKLKAEKRSVEKELQKYKDYLIASHEEIEALKAKLDDQQINTTVHNIKEENKAQDNEKKSRQEEKNTERIGRKNNQSKKRQKQPKKNESTENKSESDAENKQQDPNDKHQNKELQASLPEYPVSMTKNGEHFDDEMYRDRNEEKSIITIESPLANERTLLSIEEVDIFPTKTTVE